jgi:dihydroanticapsin dehydrogenase
MPSEPKIVIVGAANAVGVAGARALADAGWGLALLDATREPLRTLAASLDAFWTVVDVTHSAQLAAGLQAAMAALGGLDAVWSNVGLQLDHSLLETTVEELDRCWAMNVRAHVVCAQTVFPVLQAGGGGSFIITTSNAGLGARRSRLSCAITSASAISLARKLAADFAHAQIRVNALCPGLVETAFDESMPTQCGQRDAVPPRIRDTIPLGRIASAEEVAQQALFLLSDGAKLMTGQALAVDGGELIG